MSGPDTPAAVLRVTSVMADLAQLYPWLEEAAQGAVPARVLGHMHVVLEEVAANVALHAYAPDEPGEIFFSFCTGPEGAELVVEDAGPQFDPTQAALPERKRDLLTDAPGGWGLGLIRRFCPDIAYERRDDRNRLTLRFPLET